jgi:hypothetical protein
MGRLNGPKGVVRPPPALTSTQPCLEGLVVADAQSTVEYRNVPGFVGYRVGSDGSVWSCKITGAHGREGEWFVLATYVDRDGYSCARLSAGRRMRFFHVHSLVLLAFVGPCPDGMEARHLNGTPDDNRLENLCWGTPSENAADKLRHGTATIGSRNPRAKLTEEVVLEIRRRLGLGEKQEVIAHEYGVRQTTVSDIKLRKKWKHLK